MNNRHCQEDAITRARAFVRELESDWPGVTASVEIEWLRNRPAIVSLFVVSRIAGDHHLMEYIRRRLSGFAIDTTTSPYTSRICAVKHLEGVSRD
jgi:hypothetical protein